MPSIRILLRVFVGEFLGQDACHVDIDMGGIADMLLAHHVGDARGLGFEMKALDAHRREFRQIEARQDVQHHQHGDARAVRRALPDVVALVDGADRRRGLGGVRGEIVQRVQAADAAQGLDHVLGDRRPCRRRRGRPWRWRAASGRARAAGSRRRRPAACRAAADSARCWCRLFSFSNWLFQSKAMRGATT